MDILHALPQPDLAVLVLGLVLAGVVGGLLAGILGIGGGIVVVPVLYHVLATVGLDGSIRMHVAIGTSLAAGIPATLSGAQGAIRTADRSSVRELIVPALAGVALGSWLLAVASGQMLAVVFATSATVIALFVAFARGERIAVTFLPGLVGRLAFALIVGTAAALTGMGGKTVSLPASMLHGPAQTQRTDAASVLAAIVVIPASLGAVLAGWHARALPPDSLGYVNLLGFVLIAPILLLAEPAGDALAHWIDVKRLRVIFAALIVITTARMLWDALA
ncbi:MAG: sulfite exporter TauE/SafE family protein [Rhizomicrobium sp.]